MVTKTIGPAGVRKKARPSFFIRSETVNLKNYIDFSMRFMYNK